MNHKDSYLKTAETITRTVIFLVTLWTLPAEALQCKSLFGSRRIITPLSQANVIRTTLGSSDQVYKVFPPGEQHLARAEAESLRMFKHLLQTSGLNLRIKVVDSARFTAVNERGVLDFSPYAPSRNGLRPTAIVTPFVQGQEVIKILNRPEVTAVEKQAMVNLILADIETLVQWVQNHPEYRYKNQKVQVEDWDHAENFDFTSENKAYHLLYKNWFFVLSGDESVVVGLNPVSNWMQTKDGSFVLFDPT